MGINHCLSTFYLRGFFYHQDWKKILIPYVYYFVVKLILLDPLLPGYQDKLAFMNQPGFMIIIYLFIRIYSKDSNCYINWWLNEQILFRSYFLCTSPGFHWFNQQIMKYWKTSPKPLMVIYILYSMNVPFFAFLNLFSIGK